VLVLEPGDGPEGRRKVARKGSGRFTITVAGRAAHAGLAPEEGRSAGVERAHQILALRALHRPEDGGTVVVGAIEGGVARNVGPPGGRAELDARAPDRASADALTGALRALAPVTPDTTVRVDGGFHRPPMRPTPPGLRALAER